MCRILTVLLLALCLAVPTRAQTAASTGASTAASEADRTAIQQVITAQIAAFGNDDGAAAFGLAAPNIKARFGDGPTFLAMVRQAYPAVFRPRSFAFGALAPESRFLVQHVELIGPEGREALALYTMEHEPDGSWRIAGCSLVTTQHLEI